MKFDAKRTDNKSKDEKERITKVRKRKNGWQQKQNRLAYNNKKQKVQQQKNPKNIKQLGCLEENNSEAEERNSYAHKRPAAGYKHLITSLKCKTLSAAACLEIKTLILFPRSQQL